MSEIVNRVEASGIITLDLEELIPDHIQSYIDIKDQLFQGLILVFAINGLEIWHILKLLIIINLTLVCTGT